MLRAGLVAYVWSGEVCIVSPEPKPEPFGAVDPVYFAVERSLARKNRLEIKRQVVYFGCESGALGRPVVWRKLDASEETGKVPVDC